jgi:ABC transport system ATP-binding/permease protein
VDGKSLSGGSAPLLVRAQGSDRSLPAGPSYVIGRDPECDIAIADIRVSWHHAVLRLENGRWVLADNGSTNGTYARGQRVDRIEIDGECQVRLGNPADGPVLSCTVSEDGSQPEPDGEPGAARPRFATTVRIGRAPENDIVVSDPTASRQHAELRNTAGGYRIVDLDSSHGTFVNGQRVTDAALSEGDTVQVGSATFRLIGQELQQVIDTDAEAGEAPPPAVARETPPGNSWNWPPPRRATATARSRSPTRSAGSCRMASGSRTSTS